jgi:hypothetical protein
MGPVADAYAVLSEANDARRRRDEIAVALGPTSGD